MAATEKFQEAPLSDFRDRVVLVWAARARSMKVTHSGSS